MIVMTDPHGCYKTAVALLAKFPKDQKVAWAGDLVDRGPLSAEMVKLVRERGDACIMGNHEHMMWTGLLYDTFLDDFLNNGGLGTLKSYGIMEFDPKAIKEHEQLQSDLLWMEELPYFLEYPDLKNDKGQHLLITHSSAHGVWHRKEGMEKENFDRFTFENTLIWNRTPNIKAIPGIFNIFGHTPHGDNPRIKDCYANIDTGCAYIDYKKDGLGKLTALQFPEMIVYQQENLDMEPRDE